MAATSGFICAAIREDSLPQLLRERLLASVGNMPWNQNDGYSLEGRFILKATGEEIPYRARFVRTPNQWVSDFSQEDPTRNLRYALSKKGAWVASPEITADLKAGQNPYMARFDFYLLYDTLLGILKRGSRDPAFAVDAIANEVHVRGKLPNGWEATFVFNIVDYFPRKVLIKFALNPAAAWLLPLSNPDGSSLLMNVPSLSEGFEIWLSDPVDATDHRYARRMDFIQGGDVVGTFFLETSSPAMPAEALFNRPPDSPWAGSINYRPVISSIRPSLYLTAKDRPVFRARMETKPWSAWNGKSRLIALWALIMPRIGRILSPSISFRVIALAVAMFLIGLIFLLLRRRCQTGDRFCWGFLIAGILACILILLGWIAARQFHRPRDRSLIAAHVAIQYAATGRSYYATSAEMLLKDFERDAPAESMEDLGFSCQAYAFAYDLIRPGLPRERLAQIQMNLFRYAKPLLGASHGWRSNTHSGAVISAGLGMAGLALDYKPYITAARETMDKILAHQLVEGLHLSGPGPGSDAMDSAINLFFGLKNAGLADFYSNTAFRKYIDTTLQMLSPVGTLPLFGDTDLDQSARLSAVFLKAADQLPDEEGRQCVTAFNRYWQHGRFHAGGWAKWILPLIQSTMMVFENPYILLQYTRALPPSALRSSSAIMGDGQSAVLRTDGSPDAAYLALNMSRSSASAHRDILTFDLYAHRCLLLHGPGFPGLEHADYPESTRTAASNSITFNGEDQAATQCTGIESSLLNQPIFDFVRALADRTYDYGQVKRDIIMVRSDGGRRPYFLLFDDVFVSDRGTTVQWNLHGSGRLTAGIAQSSHWTAADFDPPKLRPDRTILDAAYPVGALEKISRKTGVLYSRLSFLNQISESSVIEWTGSRRFCSVLTPREPGNAQVKIDVLGKNSFRIDSTDWVSLGRLDSKVGIGQLMHISEYTVVRDRQRSFPALLMVSGLECRFGLHSLTSSKPVTVSMKGLHGGFVNPRPDTRIEIHTPLIKKGDRFLLDDQSIAAADSGMLVLVLAYPGEHSLRQIN
jgi:hypothetical protein